MFVYNLKKVLRGKVFLFWNLIFPLALMTFMNLTFGNIYLLENSINPIPSVLVKEGEGIYQDSFEEMLAGFSEESSDNRFFELTVCDSMEQAEEMLNEDCEIMFVVSDNDLTARLSEKHSQTAGVIAKSFCDSYRQNYTLISEAVKRDPSNAASIISSITDAQNESFVKPVENAFSGEPNPYVWYFYSTLVMGIFFNAMAGVSMVGDLRADVSSSAMRYSISPTKKSRMIIAAFMARLIPALAIVAIQLTAMKVFFNISLGNDPLKLIVFVVAAVIFSIGFGVLCGLFFKGSVSSRGNKATAVVMVSVFLGGEMINVLPGAIEKYCPIINDINPATVLNMAFYKLAVCGNDADYYINIIKIIGMAVLFLVVGVIVLRREKYASL